MGLMFLKELMLIRPMYHTNVLFAFFTTSLTQIVDYQKPRLCDGWYNLVEKSRSCNCFYERNYYRIHFFFWYLNRDEAINRMNNADFKGIKTFFFLSHYKN